MNQRTPPSNDATQQVGTPLPAGTDAGRTLVQTAGSQFSAFLAPPQSQEEIGRLGGFRILRLIGQGGMGFVFEGEDLKLERRVALKVMRPEVAQHPHAAGRFLREAGTAAALSSDHIVTIHHVDEQNGVPFLVMPLMAGESLHDRLHREALPIDETIRIGREAALGLAAAHAAGLIHRDIKPANLWLESPSGRVKILDFGLARSSGGSDLTATGQVLGTPQYMAPEQARGKAVDARADLFSLGAVLYRMAAGREAFNGDDVLAILTCLAVDDPAPPHEVNPAVPPALSRLILRLLAKDPDKRPATAFEVANELRALESGGSSVVVVPATLPVARKSFARRLAVAAPIAMACGVGLAVLLKLVESPPATSKPGEPPAVVRNEPKPQPEAPPAVVPEPAKPTPPKVDKPIVPQPAVVRLKPIAPLTVEAGKSIEVPIEIERQNLTGAVSLSHEGPKGVVLEPARFAPGETNLITRLTAGTDAPAGSATATLTATAGDVRHQIDVPITIQPSRTPSLVVVPPGDVQLTTGGAVNFSVAMRCRNLGNSVQLEWLELPKGVQATGARRLFLTHVKEGQEVKAQVGLSANFTARDSGTARLRIWAGDTESVQTIGVRIERTVPAIVDSTKGPIDAETVRTMQQNWADYLGKPLIQTVAIGGEAPLEFVLIPPGEFLMGSLPDDRDAYPDEQPRHRRRIRKPFYLGRTPVMKQQFEQFVRATQYLTEAESSGQGGSGLDVKLNQMVLRAPQFSWRNNGFPEPGDHPVVNVTHNDAQKFCDWLNTRQQIGQARLPSEAQWEYAGRAGSATRYIGGDEPESLRGFANVSDQSLKARKL